jgi:tetratricopeptide (TPR) repeat protein
MSPEQATGSKVGPQSDLFTVGIIFYQLLTGELPYKADSAIASLLLRAQEKAKPPRDIDPTIPNTIDDIVRKCLETKAADRYQSATDLIRDLESWKNGQATKISFAAPAPAATRKKPWLIGAAAALVLLLAVGGGMWWRSRSGSVVDRADHKTVTLLVADFDNNTGDGVFDGTLEPAFTLAMEGASFVNSFSRNTAHKIAAQIKPGTAEMDASLAQLVAAREGVNIVIGGAVERAGDGYRVSVNALDPVNGKQISSQEQRVASKSEVLPAVNLLAASLRKELGDRSITSAETYAAETYTASSIEAAHEYALGQAARETGKFEEAIQHFQQALQLDPQMGRAYAGIAVTYQNEGDRPKAEEAYKQAMQRLDRMTDREKYRTRGGYYLVTRNSQKGLEEMEALVRAFPSDSAGVANLALAYFYRRDMNKALEYGRKSIEISPKNVPQRNNVGLYAMYAGDFQNAIDEQKRVLELNPNFALAYVGTALPQLALGHPDEARETYGKLAALGERQASTATLGKADIALYGGRYNEAISLLREGISADEKRKDTAAAASKQIMLGEAYLMADKKSDAIASAEKAAASSSDDSVQISAARVFVAAGQVKKAEMIADKLAARIDADPQAYAQLIQGEVQLAQGRPSEAITVFNRSKQTADTWLVHYDLGRAYLAASAFPEANSEFETCLRRIGEATALFLDESPTFHASAPVYYYYGRGKEAMKQPSAAGAYAKFVEIMQKADPSEMIADAKKRSAQK